MEKFEYFLSMLDHIAASKQKRQLVGGFLIGVSFLFGSMAIAIITLKYEEDIDE